MPGVANSTMKWPNFGALLPAKSLSPCGAILLSLPGCRPNPSVSQSALTIDRFRFATANLDAAFVRATEARSHPPLGLSPAAAKRPIFSTPWSPDECPISALTAPVLNWNETLLK
jgi:hypothetical protein